MNRYGLLKALTLAGLAALVVYPAVSQDVRRSGDSTFGLKTTTEVVLVNVTVKDNKGAFVRDLKPDDFTLTEDGKVQKILSLDIQNTDALALNSGELQAVNLLGDLDNKSASQIQQQAKELAKAPSPTAYTKDAFRDRRLIVMFFDLQSMQPEEISRGIKSAREYIDEQMSPADFVSIISLANRFEVNQDFTTNKDDLKAAIASFDPTSGNGFEDAGAVAADAATEDSNGATDQEFTADTSETDIFNTDRKFDLLRTIAESLQNIEQRKTLLFFSGGLRANGIDNQTAYRAAVNAAVRSNTSIYTVDTRGLQAVVPGGAASQRGRGAAAFNGRGMRGQFTQLQASQDTLVSLASDTGGRSLTNVNDFGRIFTQIQADTAMYYILGYTSSNTTKDGRFRNIRVTVKLRDVRVEARRGYYADTDFQHLTKGNREKQMQDELAADLPSTDLPVYLSTGYFKLDDTRYFVPVSIVVPGNAIPFAAESDQNKATLDILGAVLAPSGGPGGPGDGRGPRGDFGGERGGRGGPGGPGGFRGDFPGDLSGNLPGGPQQGPRVFGQIKDTIKLAVNASQDVKAKNIQYDGGFMLPPGRFRLRFIVRENQLGQIGSFEADVFIPNLLQAPVKVSSVVASAQKSASKPKKDNPLTRNGTALIPSVTHVFNRNQHLYLFYEIYDPQRPEGADANNKAAMHLLTSAAFYKGNSKVYETPLTEVTQINTPERKAATIELDVPLSELKAGYYTCQVNIIDAAAGEVVFPRLALLIR